MFLGMAYYPEHWPKERWPIDAQLMREAHIQAARMGEFAWSRFEPREGELHWEWMDEAIELLASYGIKTILCTPTATPPAWLVRKHPEIQPRDSNGLLSKPFGSRRHYCPNVEIYREYSRKITTAMAQHYGNNPNVIGWQIDNEMGNVYDLAKGRCYCESCRQAFIEWLKSRYDSLQALNEAWGTVFWSQEYSDWDEIVLPTRGTSGEGLNPSHVLAYYRFFSDSWASYTKPQADILREHAEISGSRPTLPQAFRPIVRHRRGCALCRGGHLVPLHRRLARAFREPGLSGVELTRVRHSGLAVRRLFERYP